MNPKALGYWTSTTLLSVAMLASAGAYLSGAMNEGLAELGFPAHFVTLLGAWKGLVAPALLAPGLRKLKEWTYAGLFFTFTGAAVSHLAVGHHVGHVVTPFAFLGLGAVSYLLMDPVRFADSTAPDAIPEAA